MSVCLFFLLDAFLLRVLDHQSSVSVIQEILIFYCHYLSWSLKGFLKVIFPCELKAYDLWNTLSLICGWRVGESGGVGV